MDFDNFRCLWKLTSCSFQPNCLLHEGSTALSRKNRFCLEMLWISTTIPSWPWCKSTFSHGNMQNTEMHIGQFHNEVCTKAHTKYGLQRSNIRIVPLIQMFMLPKPSLQDTYSRPDGVRTKSEHLYRCRILSGIDFSHPQSDLTTPNTYIQRI